MHIRILVIVALLMLVAQENWGLTTGGGAVYPGTTT
jgi:hypothetical protein